MNLAETCKYNAVTESGCLQIGLAYTTIDSEIPI